MLEVTFLFVTTIWFTWSSVKTGKQKCIKNATFTAQAMSTAPPSLSAKTLHKYVAFDMDEKAIFRAFIVIGVIVLLSTIYCLIKCCRSRVTRSRVRKYDLMSAKDLQRTALAVDSESEDDLFEPTPSDRQKLVTAGKT